MNKIIITSFHPFVSRNILSAPFYEMLKHTGWRIMLLVPERKKEFFEREYGGIGVAVEAMPNLLSRADGIFRELAMAAIRTRSLAIMRKRGMGIFHPLLQRFFFFAPLIRSLIPFLYGYFMYTSAYRALLKKYNPSVVFATDVFSSNDCRLLLEAKRLRIPTVGMVRSWDSLTTKGGFRVIPDTLIMNNNLVKEEAMRLHGISASRIRVVGIPHYDRYLSPPARTRAEILSATNALLKDGATNVTEEEFSKKLWSYPMPDPDILIRTGGDQRLSGFLPWQSVYSELFFVDAWWPDFLEEDFKHIISEFNVRERRMGR